MGKCTCPIMKFLFVLPLPQLKTKCVRACLHAYIHNGHSYLHTYIYISSFMMYVYVSMHLHSMSKWFDENIVTTYTITLLMKMCIGSRIPCIHQYAAYRDYHEFHSHLKLQQKSRIICHNIHTYMY